MTGRLAAGVRYTLTMCAASHALAGPLFAFLLAAAVTQVSGGGLRPMIAIDCGYLFPITAWLTVVVLGHESRGGSSIAEAALGGAFVLRAARAIAAAALGLSAALPVLLLAALGNSGTVRIGALAAGAAALAVVTVGAVAAGSLCAVPVVTRSGWAVAGIVTLSVVEVLWPFAPPVGLVVRALAPHSPGTSWTTMAAAAVTTAALVALAVAFQVAVARRRT